MSTEAEATATHRHPATRVGSPDAVITTAELCSRPGRAPDYEAENRALTALMQESAIASSNPLQSVVEAALRLCRAHSAGVSLLERRGERQVFVWRALAGAWAHYLGGELPRDNSPCGTVLDRNCPLLMSHPERFYPISPEIAPAPVEALLVPFHVEGCAVGTVWIVAHDEERQFDREDLRVVEKLSQVAALALQRRQTERALAEAARINDALYRLADRLHRAISLDDVYAAALQAILSAMQCDRASILLFDDSARMRFVAWTRLSDSYRAAVNGHSPWSADARNPEPVCIHDIRTADLGPELEATITAEGIGSLAFIPLVIDDRLIGKFMAYFDSAHVFRREEIELGVAIARQLAFGIDRKRAEALVQSNARQLALITDTAPVYIAYCDTRCRYKFVNRAYAQRFGLEPRECIGKHISEVVGVTGYESFATYVQTALRGEAIEFEVNIPYPSGERFMHCSYAPEHDGSGNVVGFVAAIIDITDRRRIEESLRRSEASLREADHRKNEFLAMLAHELRNPLAPIRHATQILSMTCSDAPAIRSTLDMLERQLRQMVRLIDDLLDVSRVSRGKIELRRQHVELNAVVRDTVAAARSLYECKKQHLACSVPDDPIYVDADPTRLAQIIGNLINNACKFTDPDGKIWVLLEAQSEHALIRVRDTGVGIAAEHSAHIFELFAQVDTSIERTQSGLGIGLTLVKTLTEMHGGSVTVNSDGLGRGSEFTVRLPRLPDAPQPESSQEGPEPMTQVSRRILIVDDNRDAAVSLGTLLELMGHQTHTAFDGLEALAAADTFRPDVVLLDIGLPQLNGYEVAQRLRQESWGKELLLIALTGWGEEGSRRRSSEAGFDTHLVKPVDHGALLDLLAEARPSSSAAIAQDAGRQEQ